MRKIVAAIVCVSALSVGSMALAAMQTITGTVKVFDPAAHHLTLANGDMFILPKGFKDPGLKAGEKVKVAYIKKGSALDANQVTIVK